MADAKNHAFTRILSHHILPIGCRDYALTKNTVTLTDMKISIPLQKSEMTMPLQKYQS